MSCILWEFSHFLLWQLSINHKGDYPLTWKDKKKRWAHNIFPHTVHPVCPLSGFSLPLDFLLTVWLILLPDQILPGAPLQTQGHPSRPRGSQQNRRLCVCFFLALALSVCVYMNERVCTHTMYAEAKITAGIKCLPRKYPIVMTGSYWAIFSQCCHVQGMLLERVSLYAEEARHFLWAWNNVILIPCTSGERDQVVPAECRTLLTHAQTHAHTQTLPEWIG